jgi:hypothetical protein
LRSSGQKTRRNGFFVSIAYNAITRTFERRETDTKEYVILKTENYRKTQQAEWAAYIRKLKAATFQKKDAVEIPSRIFADVLDEIMTWLEPVMLDVQYYTWKPGRGWR